MIIARAQPGITQRQLTQLVFLVRIDPGVIKYDVGLVLIEKLANSVRANVRSSSVLGTASG